MTSVSGGLPAASALRDDRRQGLGILQCILACAEPSCLLHEPVEPRRQRDCVAARPREKGAIVATDWSRGRAWRQPAWVKACGPRRTSKGKPVTYIRQETSLTSFEGDAFALCKAEFGGGDQHGRVHEGDESCADGGAIPRGGCDLAPAWHRAGGELLGR